MRIARFSGPKWSICPKKNFFGTNHCYFFHLPIGPFHLQNLKKILQRIQNYDDAPFLDPKWSICPIFFWKIITIILIYLLAPFIVQNYKKNSSSRSRIMRMCNCLAQNGPFPQMIIFSENLFMNLVSFIHVYLHGKYQSHILIYQ